MRWKFLEKWKIIEQAGFFLAYSNLYVAFCVYVFTLQTGVFFQDKFFPEIAMFNSLSTFFLYNAQRLFQFYTEQNKLLNTRWVWLQRYASLMLVLLSLCAIGLIYLALTQINYLLYHYLLLGMVALIYFLPGIYLRRIPYLKIFIVALIWVLSCCIIPAFTCRNEQGRLILCLYNGAEDLMKYCLAQFLFIALLCIPFDIRDVETDHLKGIKTFPGQFGIVAAKGISICLVVLFLLLIRSMPAVSAPQTISSAITAIVTILLIVFTRKDSHLLYYSLMVDGAIILQFVLMVLLKSK